MKAAATVEERLTVVARALREAHDALAAGEVTLARQIISRAMRAAA